MNVMDISKEDMFKYRMCKAYLERCKYAGVTDCKGCEYDLALEKIEYINQ